MRYQLFFQYGNCLVKHLIGYGFLLTLLLICGVGSILGQSDNYHTITGRVIDDQGRPFANAGICLEPAKYTSTAFDRFIECADSEADGRFTIKKARSESTINQTQLLFVSVDNNSARTVIDPPFDLIRSYDRSFNGKPVKLDDKNLTDVGDVKVQFWFGQINLKFSKTSANQIDWPHIWLKVLHRNGRVAYFSTLSKNSINKYVKNDGSELSISLPQGKWKVEIVEFDTRRVIAESSYIEVPRNGNKDVLMKSKR